MGPDAFGPNWMSPPLGADTRSSRTPHTNACRVTTSHSVIPHAVNSAS